MERRERFENEKQTASVRGRQRRRGGEEAGEEEEEEEKKKRRRRRRRRERLITYDIEETRRRKAAKEELECLFHLREGEAESDYGEEKEGRGSEPQITTGRAKEIWRARQREDTRER